MKLTAVFFLIFGLAISSVAQTYNTNSNTSGGPYAYTTSGNWTGGIGGDYDAGAGTLTATTSYDNININQYTRLGSFSTEIDFFASGHSNPSGKAFTISDGDTLIVYGDMNFANKAMELVVGTNSMLIILGDLNMENKISVASNGIIVVKGTFNYTGSTGHNEYSGGPSSQVYADSYSTNASSEITSGGGTPEDVDTDLATEYPNLFDFVDGGGEGALPITLKSFSITASPSASSVSLNWTTASEENFDYFEIQRAAADGNFEVIETMKGNGTSTSDINYSWADENPRLGLNYYRLESVDFDGYRETFAAKAIVFEPTNRKIKVSPNPIAQNTTLTLQHTFGEEFNFKLVSLDGKVVVDSRTADNKIFLPDGLNSGIYLATYELNGILRTEKVIVR